MNYFILRTAVSTLSIKLDTNIDYERLLILDSLTYRKTQKYTTAQVLHLPHSIEHNQMKYLY